MILLAGSAATTHTVSGESLRVEDAERAAAALAGEPVSVVVLDVTLSDATGLFERLRDGELGRSDRPVVLLGDAAGFTLRSYDQRLPKPVAEPALDAALARAESVVAYRDAVEVLYERCRERAAGGVDPLAEPEALAEARDAADEALAALDDSGLVADLLDE